MACATCALIQVLLEASGVSETAAKEISHKVGKPIEKKIKRKASAYSIKYGKAFKKVAKKYKKKGGGWMKNGFKRAQKEAHRVARG